jgi:hypothetical protein
MQSEPSSRSNFPAFFRINTTFASPPLLYFPTPVFLFYSRGAYGRLTPPFSVFIPQTYQVYHRKSSRRRFCRSHNSTSDASTDTSTLCYIRNLIRLLCRHRWRPETRASPGCIRSLLAFGRQYLHRRPQLPPRTVHGYSGFLHCRCRCHRYVAAPCRPLHTVKPH